MLMILPASILFLLFVPMPAIVSVVMSFTNWKGLGSIKFIGLENYLVMFTKDIVLQKALANTFKWVFGGLVMQLLPAFLLSLLISGKIKGRSFFRSVIFMPSTFSAVAVSLIWYFVYHPSVGLLNQFIRLLGFSNFEYVWLRDPRFALVGVLLSVAWQWTGYYVVIFISGIVGVPKELSEAATIDGASPIQVVRHILLPYLMPVFKIVCVLSVTSAFKGFASVFVMTQGGPNNETILLGLHMYNKGFMALRYGYGSAISVLIMFCCIVSTVIINKIFERESIGE